MNEYQLVTKPEAEDEGHIIKQSYGPEFSVRSESRQLLITNSYKHRNNYRDKDFSSLEFKHDYSPRWITVEMGEVKADTNGTLRRRSLSMSLNKEHIEQMILNLQDIVTRIK